MVAWSRGERPSADDLFDAAEGVVPVSGFTVKRVVRARGDQWVDVVSFTTTDPRARVRVRYAVGSDEPIECALGDLEAW